MSNTSATGGYLAPTTPALPGNLTFQQFMQAVLVGITGLDGPLVRPRWQLNPPKQPQPDVDWMAFGISNKQADANGYLNVATSPTASTLSRHETFDVECSFYGPDADANAQRLREGLQISQNREVLFKNNMAFKGDGPIVAAPELVNDRWYHRRDITLTFARQIQSSYQILTITSSGGTVKTDGSSGLSDVFDSLNGVEGAFDVGTDQSAML